MITTVKVKEIIDGDTFLVSPFVIWVREFNLSFSKELERSDKIRPIGYNTPEQGSNEYYTCTEKLSKLILGKEVEIKRCVGQSYDRLLCEVYFNGKNLADYFPEYKI